MPYIYKIINNVNNKVYIGKTIRSLEIRFKEHLKDSDTKDSKLYRAMRKYGKKNFSIKKIEEVSKEILSERERFWIREYNSYYNGYNSTFGGDGESSTDEEEIIELYQLGKTMKEISEITSYTQKTISSVLKRNSEPIRKNTDYCSENLYNKKNVKCINFSKTEEFEFQSMTEAANFIIKNGYTKSQNVKSVINKISLACNGKRQSAFGFIWNKK